MPSKFLWLYSLVGGVSLAAAEPAGSPPAEGSVAPGRLIQSVPLLRSPVQNASTLFESLPGSQTGIDLVYQFPTNAPFEYLQDQGCAAGVCLGDYDGDGYPDIYLTHYNRGNRLYHNLGQWRFEDVTVKAGVGGSGGWCAGATFVDIDNDGDLDLFVCVFNGPNLLYINQGDGTFREQAKAYGLDLSAASVMMAFADYDQDGRLDGYLVTHRLNVGREHLLPKTSQDAFRRSIIHVTGPGQVAVDPRYAELFAVMDRGQGRTELIIAGQQDYLFHNEGNGRFAVVNERAGISGRDIGLAATWWDFNDDGLPDLYVSNDYKGPDRLYRNNGNGTFTDVARTALPHVPWSSMGADVADLNNDGRLDLMATDMAGSTRSRRMFINADLAKEAWFLTTSEPRQFRRNAVYLSTGTEQVLELACLTGLDSTDWTWSPKFGDFDNDGRVDLFVANGMSRDFMDSDSMNQMKDRGNRRWLNAPVLREENLAFRNLGDLRFQSIGKAWGLDHLSASFGAACGDLDRDGNVDLVVANFDEPVSVYRNRGTGGHSVLIRLKGRASNAWGIGAKIRAATSAGVQARFVSLSSGVMSANEPVVHFGLGEGATIDELTVEWPSRRLQTFRNLAADRFYTITEPDEGVPSPRPEPSSTRWFNRVESVPGARHRERPFEDFQREPMLPWKLSQLGPGLAVGDVNGDGQEDLYLGGAAGQAGSLWLNEGNGRFRRMSMPCFEEDKDAEDMGALFFDLDGDGDLDLFVVSGGVECPAGSPFLRDRLYLNDGHGRFTKAPDTLLPDWRASGSCVVAADFDRDGDLDLFVGARCVPGKYPQAPQSRLLRNDHGVLVDVTDSLAPGLRNSGLVTSAIWSDADGDGWSDLFVTHEWGPVTFYRNHGGHLVEETHEAGLDQLTGFWNGIAARDLDNDGAIDYVVTNLGLNTPYHASPQQPAVAFVVPVRGQEQFIQALYDGDTLYPLRSRNSLLSVWPDLAEKFPTFRSFASARLSEVVPGPLLESARRLEVNTLESGLLLNDGHARFTFVALPRIAQAAPGFGVVATDLNGDGRPDLYLVQNFYSPEPETGRMDGGLSQLLTVETNRTLTVVEPNTSGLIVLGDAKSLAVADLNGDGRPDLLVGVNNSDLLVFTNCTPAQNRMVGVRLRGLAGNPAGVGSFVTAYLSDGSRQCDEVRAGGGYLSQSTSTLYFGLGTTNWLSEVRIRWADGALSSVTNGFSTGSLTIPHPQFR